MNYKMVVTDLDGTLLNDNKTISDEDVKMLNELHNNGVEIVIATGRNYFMAKKLTEQIKNINPIILSNNGSISRRLNTDELLNRNYLESDIFEIIYKKGLNYNRRPIILVDEYDKGYDIVYDDENIGDLHKYYIKRNESRARMFKYTSNLNNILSVCYLDHYENLFPFIEEMKGLNNNQFNIICNRNISEVSLLEFLHVEGCKWRALKKYAHERNIKQEEIISFGDDNNDLEMLKNSGMGIAMKNGTLNCINSAKKTSERDNNNSGVSYELAKLFQF